MSFCRVRDYHWHLPLERARMMIAFLLGALGLIYMTTYLAAEETSQLARHCNWLVSWTVDSQGSTHKWSLSKNHTLQPSITGCPLRANIYTGTNSTVDFIATYRFPSTQRFHMDNNFEAFFW